MDLKLQGKTALVSGSSSGIGASIARILGQEGVTVVVHGRNVERTQRVADEISRAGGKAFVTLGDLSRDDDAERVVQEALDKAGQIDILVNNAAVFPLHDWQHTDAAAWLDVYNANVGSIVRLTRPLMGPMKERGWGRILNLSSTGAINAPAFVPDYVASKGAILSFTVSLSKELAKTGVTVNTISPGPIETEGVEGMMQEIARISGQGEITREQGLENFRSMWQLATTRLGLPEDVGNIAAFLASPLADYITGSNFRVDGGHAAVIN